MTFRWRADDGPKLNAGLVALWFFRVSGPELLWNCTFLWFFRGGDIRTPCPPLWIRLWKADRFLVLQRRPYVLHHKHGDALSTVSIIALFVRAIILFQDVPRTYSKTCLKELLQKIQKLVFKTIYRLNQVKSIAEDSKGSILQCFRPSISYHFPLRPLFCLFLSGRLRQLSLYSE